MRDDLQAPENKADKKLKNFLKILDKSPFLLYIIIGMRTKFNNPADAGTIDRFIEYCKARRFDLKKMALIAGRTPAWASQIVNGKIRSLNFSTRTVLLEILGEQHGASDGAGGGQASQNQ